MRVTLNPEADVEEWIPAKSCQSGPQKRCPFSSGEALLLSLPLVNDLRVKTKARIADEYLTVDFAHVDTDTLTSGDLSFRCIQREGKPKVLGKEIQRAERQNPKRNVVVDQGSGYCAHRAITAPATMTSACRLMASATFAAITPLLLTI